MPLHLQLAPLHSTFIQQIDGVSCHPACLLTLHCALSRCVVKGILQVPQERLWLLREMAEATLYFSRSKSASTPRTPAARMYPQHKSVDPVDTCFSCDGTRHMRVLTAEAATTIGTPRRVSIAAAATIAEATTTAARLAVQNWRNPTQSQIDTRWTHARHNEEPYICGTVCGSIASGMQCLLNIPKMLMVN